MYRNCFTQNNEYKAKINTLRPLLDEALAQVKEYYKIGLTYASNAIEGNTLSLVETKVVLEDGITIGGKPLKDHYETVGHAKAFDKIIELSKNEFRILLILIQNKGKVVSREKLMNQLWKTDIFIDENTLTVNVNRLRKKLSNQGIGDLIKTKFGVGYIVE